MTLNTCLKRTLVAIHLPLLVCVMGLLNSACLVMPNPSTKAAPGIETSNTVLSFGDGFHFKSGQIASTSLNTINQQYPTWTDPSAYCFDNATSTLCARASAELRAEVLSYPVAIQALQLIIGRKTDDTITLSDGWFVTAEPRVDTVDGNFHFVDRQIRTLSNGSWTQSLTIPTSCNPADANGNSVGYAPQSGDSQRILTGLQVFGDANVAGLANGHGGMDGYSRTYAYVHAAKVWYSGFLPVIGTATVPFAFKIVPELPAGETFFSVDNYAASTTFGRFPELLENGAESGVDGGPFFVPKIGLTPADQRELKGSNWYSHVIVGFCLKGTRNEPVIDGGSIKVLHPLFFGIDVRTHTPVMKTTTPSVQ